MSVIIALGCFALVAWAIYLIGYGLKEEFYINPD